MRKSSALFVILFVSKPLLVDCHEPEPFSQAFLKSEAASPRSGPGPVKAFFSLLLGFYQNGVSPADGPTCAFYPTCAGYSRDALRHHGLAEGILMTGDRLIRCNGFDKSMYPMIGHERHFYDPIP
jgi:uncharacterized protein